MRNVVPHGFDYLRRYAPTSSYEEEEVEAFIWTWRSSTRRSCLLQGHNWRLQRQSWPKKTPEELHIGTHGLQWNDQGRLSEFIMTTKTIHGNSQFQKPSSHAGRESPGGGYRNEIDHIIVNKGSATDVAVVPKFYTGSDHRLLRGRFSSRESRESRQVQQEIPELPSTGIFRYVSRLWKIPRWTT
ncbi:hypothetical protein RB195_010998 [Necator americanus]|uniref:Endonuclease/exonuclease/phosphatase domain-containing protein n=1 Tax=Necator americanus TaxID=51031 RepID=A0ABR1D0E4_NECAM